MALRRIRLVLFFTRGVSLADWLDGGILERELVLYRAIRPQVRGITLITHGGGRDAAIAATHPDLADFQVVCNRWNWPGHWYERALAFLPARWHRQGAIFKSNQVNGGEIALRLAQRLHRPFIARCGYLLTYPANRRHGPDPEARQKAADLERQLFTQADGVVVTTAIMQQVVAERYQVPLDRIRIIPNPVETERFRPGTPLDPAVARILFVGRLSPEKNLEALVAAVAGLGVELQMIGDGPLREELRHLAATLGVNLRLSGRISNRELPALMQQARIFILPSLYEGHPKALLEAMACGLAVIGADVPGIREVIRHGETGWLCPPDADSLRQALRTLLGDADLRRHLGANARRSMIATVALDRIVAAELALLHEIAWNHTQVATYHS